jgi:hypothetical protein
MTDNSETQRISDLTEEERKLVEEKIKYVQFALRNIQTNLQDYTAGRQMVIKFLGTILIARQDMYEACCVLIKAHKLTRLAAMIPPVDDKR